MTEQVIGLDYEPHPYQREIHDALATHRFAVLVCHRRFGKTIASIHALIDNALRDTRPRARYAYLAPYLTQAKSVAWATLSAQAMKIPGTRKNESELFVEFVNGARIRIYGADNAEALRGNYYMGVVIDEVSDMKNHVWGEILRPALSDYKGFAVFIGTPKGQNILYDLYSKAQTDPTWFAAMYRADETNLPWLDDYELEQARASMSKNQYAQEFLCDFSASAADVCIPIDLVVEAAQRVVPSSAHLEGLPKVIGVDVARFGGDRSCIVRRWGHHLFNPYIFDGLDNMQLVGHVAQHIQEFNPDAVFIDGGRGEGVIDRLRQLGYDVQEINFGAKATNPHYKNRRTEMMFNFREWLEAGGVIPNDPGLKTELSASTYKFNSSNQAEACKKDIVVEIIGRSPDVADAAILTVAVPVVSKATTDSRFNRNRSVDIDRGNYHPHNRLQRKTKGKRF